MKKKRIYGDGTVPLLTKLLRIMKVSLFLIFILAQVSASTYSQTAKLTLNLEKVPLSEFFNKIEENSEFKFFYDNQEIDPLAKISVVADKSTIENILVDIFTDTDVSYEIFDRYIILKKSPILGKAKKSLTKRQEITVKGVVTDANGSPLPGVNVVEKGTTNGAVTNLDGQYAISISFPDAILSYSYVGYLTEEMNVSGQSTIDVILIEDIQSLDEVVVIGYGTQKKATVTESIVSIKAEELTTTTNGNTVNMLTGKLPGLRVTQRSSEPGDYSSEYDIRGFGTPLIVVDGVPRSDFNRIDPNEIESVSVLKDASAAVYGVKGGNGVILITTKKGIEGKTEFNYTSSFGWITPTKFPDLLNSSEWCELTNEAYINSGSEAPFSKETIEQYKNGTLPSTDWYSLVVNKYSPQQHHNISASGSSERIKYYASLGYFEEVGLWKTGDLNANRYNLRSNITADLTSNLQAEILIGGYKDTKNSPGGSAGIFQALYTEIPTIPIYANNNPDYMSNMADATHPLAITNRDICGYDDKSTYALNGSVSLKYNFAKIDGLKAKVLYAYDIDNGFQKVWQKAFNLYDYDEVTETYSVTGTRNSPTSLSQYFIQNTSSTAQASLEYANTFMDNHNFTILLLAEERKQSGIAFQGYRQYSIDAVDELYAGNTDNQSTTSTAVVPNVNMGIVGRLNYDYKGKYMFTASFREDASSKFAEGHRWGFFPAVSGGWRISEESFLDNKLNFLNNLKLKVSYGILGDDASSTYQYLSGYNYPGTNYVFNNNLVNGLGFRGLTNENLTWYTNNLFNTGIEADLFNNQIHIEADYFSKKREGLLATRNLSLPGTVGASLPQENLNSDLTKGVELLLGFRDLIGEFKYRISANIAYTRTKNLYIEQSDPTNSYANWRSNSAYRWNDSYFGYKAIGQFQSMEEIINSPVQDGNGNRNLLPGDIKYEDLNKDGIIDNNDVQIVGRASTTPELTFGFTLDMQWHGFDFNALFQGASIFTVSYLNTIAYDSPLAWGRNGLDVFMDRWHHEDLFDTESPWVSGKYPSTRFKGGITRVDSWNYQASDFWLRDATYLRLKSLELGYTVPTNTIMNGHIKSMRVYVNGYNLLTWTGLNDLIDPEHPSSLFGLYYPITKSYNLGLNITF